MRTMKIDTLDTNRTNERRNAGAVGKMRAGEGDNFLKRGSTAAFYESFNTLSLLPLDFSHFVT